MSTSKIRFEQIEQGRVLKQLVEWFKISHQAFPQRFNTLRDKTRRAARAAGIGPQGIPRLIAQTRSRRAHP